MVGLVDVDGMRRWVQDTGPEEVVRLLISALEEDFRRWPSFERTPRVASHSPSGVIELMPTSDGQTYGCKYVNGHPSNPARGFQTVTAYGVLADVSTGYPTFLAEMTLLTALRTAATSALAARPLARRGARTMAMIGAGSQAEFQALGFRAALGIQDLRVWDCDEAAMRKLRRNLEPLGFSVVVASDVADAVEGADVITTCTADKARAVVLPDDLVAPGVHVNAIGGDCPGKTELDPRTLRRATVVVELAEQTRVEGEVQQVPADFPVVELWEVVAGLRPGRTREDEITIFDSVGFAIEDFSALRCVRDAVTRPGTGTGYLQEVDLIAEPADPKDLFSLIAEAPALLR